MIYPLIFGTKIGYGVDAPRFREVDVNAIDHTRKPSHGMLYENVPWRLRGLPDIPRFENFRKMVESYEQTRRIE